MNWLSKSYRALSGLGLIAVLGAAQACGDDDDNATPSIPRGGSSSRGGATSSGGADAAGESSTDGNSGGRTSGGRSSSNGGSSPQTSAGESNAGGNSEGGASTAGGHANVEGGSGPVGAGGEGAGPSACTNPTGPGGCYACDPDGSDDLQFLNRCSDSDCSPFDNSQRIPGFSGTLPPLN
ncbi:MAG TPA: hypothetical protein VFQ61_26915 [Polyangiaceae bacterium]|nr:hypothetical protein [Polyangiaceae bacterium]